ncbi:hypothetical protein ACFWYW_24015 [Nonomuraea sp. NPDC059023]|uniref:hypothetical protein n=1 Tax=unclassified Nonomuraea TaxID=2593643 RepID=UPI0036A04FE3
MAPANPAGKRRPRSGGKPPAGLKLTGRLADLGATKKEGGLLGDIQAHLIAKADAPSDRRQDIIHPSEMASAEWCPRQTFYRIRDVRQGTPVTADKHGLGLLSIFEEGHSLHAKWQSWIRQMGRLKGRWDCLTCQRKGVDFGEDPISCPKCDSVVGLVYGEVPLDGEKEHLIAGHADGWVGESFIEIKSIGKGTLRLDVPELVREHTHPTAAGKKLLDLDGIWAAIKRPLAPHVRQANIYLHLAALTGIPVKSMIFIYEFKANQQTRSFEIKPSPRIIEPLLAKADAIRDAIAGGPLPDRAHHEPDKKPCASCAWVKECWKVEDGIPQPEPGHGQGRGEDPGPAGTGVRRVARTRPPGRDATGRPERRDRARRPGPDAPVRRDDPVGRVLRRATGQGPDRREVLRQHPGDPPRPGRDRQAVQDRDGSQGRGRL